METTYYTLRAHEIIVQSSGVAQVSGGEGRRLVFARRTSAPLQRQKKNNVISLDTYHSRMEQDREEELTQEEAPIFVPRTRTSHSAFSWLEVVTSASLIAVALSACSAFLF